MPGQVFDGEAAPRCSLENTTNVVFAYMVISITENYKSLSFFLLFAGNANGRAMPNVAAGGRGSERDAEWRERKYVSDMIKWHVN